MLSALVFAPLAVGVVLASWPRLSDRAARTAWLVASGLVVVGVAGLWAAYATGAGRSGRNGIGFEVDVPWIPGAGSRYHLGLDGLSLPLVALTAVIFFACAVYGQREDRRPRLHAALFLALESTCLGLFSSLDLILFFVFFDLSIVGMYAAIVGWGHGERARASGLKFFLYTFVGSLALLVGFVGLYATSSPHTFDMVELTRQAPLHGHGAAGGFILLAIALGLGIKTPTFPFHTWLPPAHTDASAPGSAVLAGVLLKMGAYGFVRIAMPMLPSAWRRFALVLVVVGVVSIVYGALVALAQTSFKRMVAYTSVNHMGFVVLAVGAAGLGGVDDAEARAAAVAGAITQMVSHGLLTGALFLLAGVLLDRGGTYEMAAYGGLAAVTPRFATLTSIAAMASLGLPGFSGFIAEFQVLAGSVATVPVAVVAAAVGLLVTAALFLWAIQRLFLGPQAQPPRQVADLTLLETAAVAPLLLLSLLIGILPRTLLDVVEPAARAAVRLVSR